MSYLFAAFLVLWGVTFGYVLWLNARERELRRKIEVLAERTADRHTVS